MLVVLCVGMSRHQSWLRITVVQNVDSQNTSGYVWCVAMSAVEDILEDTPTSEYCVCNS